MIMLWIYHLDSNPEHVVTKVGAWQIISCALQKVDIWDSEGHFIHIVTGSFLNVGWTRASHKLMDSMLNQETNPQGNWRISSA
jgi:hypothetical protein